MKIFGIKLHPSVRFVHEDDWDEAQEEESINPEKDYSSACHLYESKEGVQYIGFDTKLGLNIEEMKKLLKNKGRIYKL